MGHNPNAGSFFLFSGCNFNTEIRQFAIFAVNYIGIMT